MEVVMLGLEVTRGLAMKAGPYLVVEILLPGGTLLALLLWLYRRRAAGKAAAGMTPARTGSIG